MAVHAAIALTAPDAQLKRVHELGVEMRDLTFPHSLCCKTGLLKNLL